MDGLELAGPEEAFGHAALVGDDGGPQAVWFRTSSDGGRTWTGRSRLSAPAAHSTGPAIEAAGRRDLRVWFASLIDRGRWNIFARRSLDGGLSWTAPVKISDAISGNGYDNASGFLEFYGDYGEIAVTNRGRTVATWGAGFSWLGPGNVYSAEDWRLVLEPVIARYRERGVDLYFRADAAFAKPELYELLELEGIRYAIRLPANQVLQRRIVHLLTRPVGRPPKKPIVTYASFHYEAKGWTRARRVVAKVEWHQGELYRGSASS